jgi:hypothetical protein
VLVACEQGDPRRTIVVGGLWSKTDPPPSDDGKKVDNNWRFFRSRSGHLMKFDDTSGAERIEIVERRKFLVAPDRQPIIEHARVLASLGSVLKQYGKMLAIDVQLDAQLRVAGFLLRFEEPVFVEPQAAGNRALHDSAGRVSQTAQRPKGKGPGRIIMRTMSVSQASFGSGFAIRSTTLPFFTFNNRFPRLSAGTTTASPFNNPYIHVRAQSCTDQS